MTAEEYEQKYGQKPVLSSTPAPTQQKKPLANKISDFLGFKGVTDEYGATIARAKAPTQQEKDSVEFPSTKEVVGSAIQGGANFLGGLGAGAGLAGKVIAGAAQGYAYDVGSKLQGNKSVGQSLTPGAGTVVGGALPVAGKLLGAAGKITGRLLKGLGSGMSGVSSDTITKLVENPEYAKEATRRLQKSGNFKVLEDNAKTLLNGVTKIQNEASSAYRHGLDQLSEVDIKPEKLKQGFFSALEKNKIGVSEDGKIDFSQADFLDPKIQQKAEQLITTINTQNDLSGTGVRKLMDIVDNTKFKSAPDGERQAFNAFVGDLKNGFKEGINASTSKLQEINSKYSTDMQLSEAAQDIFGGVNFKNLSEVAKAANRLEGLFSEKGIDPQIIDDYLKRIGVNPEEFKTGEAVRQISNKTDTANSKGVTMGEITRSITSSVVTPKMIRDLSIFTGMSKNTLSSFWKKLAPGAKAILLNAISQQNSQPQPTPEVPGQSPVTQ